MCRFFFYALFHLLCMSTGSSHRYQEWRLERRFQPPTCIPWAVHTTHLVIDLKRCSHLLEDESEYLRGNVWVASGETGHNPDVSGSYQAQGPSFLQYIPVEERRRRVNEDLLQRSGSVWQRDRKREKEKMKDATLTRPHPWNSTAVSLGSGSSWGQCVI